MSKKQTASETKVAESAARAKLSTQRLKFIDEYMKDRNADRAARGAGYSENYAGKKSSALLRVPEIAHEIDRRTLARANRLDLQMDDIILELKRIAFFDVRKLFDPATGKFIADPHELDEDDARGLINFDVVVLDREGNYAVKLNPGNKMKALEMLAKHLGMLGSRVEHSGNVTVNFTADFGTIE